MSRNSQIGQRKNYHVDKMGEFQNAANSPLVHIFTKNKNNKLFEGLEKQLKGKSYLYEYHEDFSKLKPFLSFCKTKAFVIVCTEDPQPLDNSIFPENYNASVDQIAKLYTLPTKLNVLGIPNLSNAKQVLEAIAKFTSATSNKIKLASVHSIKVSKDKKIQTSSSIKKINTEATYQKVYYYRNASHEYGVDDQTAYSTFVESLEGEANFESFKSGKELEKKQPPKGKKKYLLITSTNQDSLKIIKDLKKAKLRYFDYLLLGNLNPNENYLEENVILASSDPLKHINFLLENGFQSYNLRNISNQFSKNASNLLPKGPPNNKISNIIPTTSTIIAKNQDDYHIASVESPQIQQKIIGHEDVEKKKIRKIKSPSKARITQPESKSEINNVNIVVSKHKDEPITENEEFRVNKQGEKIFKRESQQQRQQLFETPIFTDPKKQSEQKIVENVYVQSRYDSVSPPVESQFLTKKASGIQSKYRKNPSVIIQQMSDQYRGSNKESIMNLQPQKQKTQINHDFYQGSQNQPYEEAGMRRVVNKVMTSQPQTYYMNSANTIEYIKTNPNISEKPSSNIKIPNETVRENYGSNYNNNYNSNYSYANNYSNPTTVSNNYTPYISTNSPRIISATPMTITSVGSNSYGSQNNVRTYGYQSPPKVIRKEEVATPLQIVEVEPMPKEQNRQTFGLNYTYSNNTLNYSNNNNSINTTLRGFPSSSNNYYNAQTLNNAPNTVQPYNSNIHITAGKTQQVISPARKETVVIEQVKTYTPNYLQTPKIQEKGTKQFITSTLFNTDEYDQIQRDGRIVYRKKIPIDGKQYTPINYVSPRIQKGEESSPSVKRYQVSPIRREQNMYQYVYDDKKKEPQQENKYEYAKITSDNYSPKSNYEVISIPYKGEDHNLGEMIESSHKKKAESNQSPNNNGRTIDNKNFVSVSYRNDDKNNIGIANNYKQYGGVRVYGVSNPRVEVERVERVEKLQPKVEAKVEGLSPNHKINAMNESNWFSRMSQLHSDGSILRRNNIRFGVKLQKKEQKIQPNNSVMQNKMVSGIYKLNDLNKKMALNRIIRGQEYIDEEREKYIHINSKLNRFHFIIQQEMDYLVEIVSDHLANPLDKIDKFTGISSLFACFKAENEEDAFDMGFIFAKSEEIAHINAQLIPQHYFTVSIEKDQQGLLQINEAQKKIKIDQLRHFSLVQKIILDSKLFQYVAYRNNQQEIQLLADKFMNSQFILEKIETQFTTEILDCYYYELPRLTRLYVLCDEQELPKMLGLIKTYAQINPNFSRESCKLVCVLSNILGNDELIMSHPNVTFISNPEEIKHYKDILKYTHHLEDPYSQFLPIDNIFYYQKHKNLDEDLANHYPGRFLTFPFSKVSELYPKIDKMDKVASRYNYKPKHYLVLHENVNAQKIRVQYFAKIFMLGKAKVIQNKVVRVMNTQQLIQLLKK